MKIKKQIKIGIIGPYKSNFGIGIGGYAFDFFFSREDVSHIFLFSRSIDKSNKLLNNSIRYNKKVIESFDISTSYDFFNLNFDIILISSPTETHFEYLKLVEKRNVIIVVEKPIFNYPFSQFQYNSLKDIIQNRSSIFLNCQRNILVDWQVLSGEVYDSIELVFSRSKIEKDDYWVFIEKYLAHGLSILMGVSNFAEKIEFLNKNFSNYDNVQNLEANFHINNYKVKLKISSTSEINNTKLIFKSEKEIISFESILKPEKRTKIMSNYHDVVWYKNDFFEAFLNKIVEYAKGETQDLSSLISNNMILKLLDLEQKFFL